MRPRTIGMVLSLLLTTSLGSADKPRPAADQTLTAGAYTATVKAIVCEGCAAFIKETLEKNKALDQVSVDPKTKIVHFSVKKGSQVKTSDLQSALKTAAEAMGMGANYELVGLKAEKQPKS